MQGRDAEAQKDFERYLVHRPKARDELDDAVGKWKKEPAGAGPGAVDDLAGCRPAGTRPQGDGREASRSVVVYHASASVRIR